MQKIIKFLILLVMTFTILSLVSIPVLAAAVNVDLNDGGGGTTTSHTHNYSEKNTSSTYLASKATCTSAAKYYYKCSGCTAHGTTTFASGNALGHDYSGADATCTEGKKCKRCNAELTPSLGHNYSVQNTSSTYLVSKATCTSAAKYYYKCSRCTAHGTTTFTVGNALGHEFVYDRSRTPDGTRTL